MSEIKSIDIAAALYGCEPGELLSYRERKNGDISVIAPTGQKFVYAKILIDDQRKELAESKKLTTKPILPKPMKPEPKPRRKAPAARKRAPAKDNSAKKKSVPS